MSRQMSIKKSRFSITKVIKEISVKKRQRLFDAPDLIIETVANFGDNGDGVGGIHECARNFEEVRHEENASSLLSPRGR